MEPDQLNYATDFHLRTQRILGIGELHPVQMIHSSFDRRHWNIYRKTISNTEGLDID